MWKSWTNIERLVRELLGTRRSLPARGACRSGTTSCGTPNEGGLLRCSTRSGSAFSRNGRHPLCSTRLSTLHIVSIAFFLATMFPPTCTADSTTIELKPEVQISNAFIRLSDVADFGDTAVETRQTLENILLGRAPDLGGSTNIVIEQIRTELRKAGMDPTRVKFKGPQTVKVTRVGAAVPSKLAFILATEIEKFLVNKYKLYDTELVVEIKRVFFGIDPPAGDDIVVLDIKCETSEPLGTVLFDVTIQDSESRQYTGIATASVRAYRNVLVAKAAFPANYQLRESDVEFRRTELTRLTKRAELTDVVGARLRKPLGKGEELLLTNLKQPPAVFSRDVVTITSNTNGVELRFRGIALEDGAVDDTIRVQNDVTGDIIRARVLKPGLVSVIDDQFSSK